MSDSNTERRVWQCPMCERRYKIPTSTKDPKHCPKCKKAYVAKLRPGIPTNIDSIRFLRLLPPDIHAGPLYESGLALFLASVKQEGDYLLSLPEEGARQLASDLNDYFAGRIDIGSPGEYYGTSEE